MTRTIITGSNCSPYFRINRTLSWNPLPNFVVIKHRDQRNFQGNFDLRWKNTSPRKIVVYDSNSTVPPQPPVTSETPPPPPPQPSPPPPADNSFIGQIMGLATAILGSKFGPIWMFKERVDNTVDTVEQVVNAVENVAEQLENAAEDFSESLPEGKLKNLVDFVEEIAEKTADSADMIGDLIDKVQEVEDQVEDLVESLGKKQEESAKSA